MTIAFAAMIGFVPTGTATTSTATPDDNHPRGGIVVVAAAVGDGDVAPLGSDCGGLFDPCGIVNNRTGKSLQAARDSKSHTSCSLWPDSSSHPRKWVAPGRNSNQSPEYFKDTDCFRSTTCSVYYLGWHAPGEWVRIWSSVYIYDLGC